MDIRIEPVTTPEQRAAAASLRQKVFGDEWGIQVPNGVLSEAAARLQLLARVGSTGAAAATLTVLETTGNEEMYSRYGLRFEPGTRAARFTQLAVLKPYRGLGLPLALIADAHWRCIVPGGFDFTWLLFDAARAESCSLRRAMRFNAGAQVFDSEYGPVKVLLRTEHNQRAEAGSCYLRSWRMNAATVVITGNLNQGIAA